MAKVQVTPRRPVHPTPAALITSTDEEGNANIIALGEAFNVSIADPVILGIAIHTRSSAEPENSSSICRRRPYWTRCGTAAACMGTTWTSSQNRA